MLVPEVASGAAAELDGLRAACDGAVRAALAERPDRFVLVGAGDGSPFDPTLPPSLAPYGLPGPSPGLPLAFTIGCWLLDRAGWTGPRDLVVVPAEAGAEECAARGRVLAGAPGRTALVALGDGTARRSLAAPGHLDERAVGFDQGVAAALVRGDSAAVLAVDPTLAVELLVPGRGAWQVLAGGLPRPADCRLLYCDAPYGVAYFVACWRPGP